MLWWEVMNNFHDNFVSSKIITIVRVSLNLYTTYFYKCCSALCSIHRVFCSGYGKVFMRDQQWIVYERYDFVRDRVVSAVGTGKNVLNTGWEDYNCDGRNIKHTHRRNIIIMSCIQRGANTPCNLRGYKKKIYLIPNISYSSAFLEGACDSCSIFKVFSF